MITIIITSYKEEKTIGRAIESILKNKLNNYEILVTAPDESTLKVARTYQKKNKNIKVIRDFGKGKPAALNIAISKSRGDILILTDGDVYIGEKSLAPLISFFKNPNIGAVSGNPNSLNSRKNLFGYWADILTKTANFRRKKAVLYKKRFFCSGYLFAIRKKIFPILPEGLLSEDGFISHLVYSNGYRIGYSESSMVYVKYPTNFKDWILQKKRSAGGYSQIKKMINTEIRSFKKESSGFLYLLKEAKSFKELWWIILLFLARVYLWILIYKEIRMSKKDSRTIWKRVESTK